MPVKKKLSFTTLLIIMIIFSLFVVEFHWFFEKQILRNFEERLKRKSCLLFVRFDKDNKKVKLEIMKMGKSICY